MFVYLISLLGSILDISQKQQLEIELLLQNFNANHSKHQVFSQLFISFWQKLKRASSILSKYLFKMNKSIMSRSKHYYSLQFIKQAQLIKSLSMPKRQYSLRMEREVQELEYLKVKLNQHLRVVNSTQLSFHSEVPENYCTLPTVQQQKIKIKSDRYSSEKQKYQNNLRTVLFQIRKKMEQTTRGQVKNIKFRSARKPQSLSPINRQTFDFKIKAVNLSPEPKQRPNPLTKSFIQRQSPRKIEKKRHIGKYFDQNTDKFVFEPWYQKDQLEFYTLDR